MANPEHVKMLELGAEVWNDWRKANPDIRPILSGANLYGADLRKVNLAVAELVETNLTEANLSGANLNATRFVKAGLSRTNCEKADLTFSDLSMADLSNANLRRADLVFANLSGAILQGADFTGATVGFSAFVDVDLSEAKGLERIEHEAPSSVGIDTIYRSKGTIAQRFLWGAGVPEKFIASIDSLVGNAFIFHAS